MIDNDAAPPSVTLALFCYRQAAFIREAVASVLAQTYQPLEIIISDDDSPDDTFAIVEDMVRGYTGPHRIILNRNPENLGIGAHVNRLMELASSEVVVIAAGDDASRSDRVERIMAEFTDPDCYLVHSAARLIDKHGEAVGQFEPELPMRGIPSLADMATGNLSVIGATAAWRREIFRRFGPLDKKVICEDLILPFRATMLGKVRYVSEPLVDWRRVGVSSDFQSKRGRDVLFGQWVEWQRRWHGAYNDRLTDLRHFYGDMVPKDVMAICEREGRRYGSVVELAASGAIARFSLIGRLLTSWSLPLGWRVKTSLMYAMPRLYAAFYDWKMRRGMIV